MRLYCQCGYPIVARARWDGQDVCVSMRDGNNEAADDSIFACPRCGQTVRLGDLRPSPQRSTRWFTSDDEGVQRSEHAS
jgi:hypothetical protein